MRISYIDKGAEFQMNAGSRWERLKNLSRSWPREPDSYLNPGFIRENMIRLSNSGQEENRLNYKRNRNSK